MGAERFTGDEERREIETGRIGKLRLVGVGGIGVVGGAIKTGLVALDREGELIGCGRGEREQLLVRG